MNSLAQTLFIDSYRVFILIAIAAILLVISIHSIKNSINFINHEELFDCNYVKRRKSFPLHLKNAIYPYNSKRFNFNCDRNCLRFLNKIYDEIKDFESELSKRFFNCRDQVQCEKVRNILSVIPNVKVLTLQEYKQIEKLIKRISMESQSNSISQVNTNQRSQVNTNSDKSVSILGTGVNPVTIPGTSYNPVIIHTTCDCINLDAKSLCRGLSSELNINLCIYRRNRLGSVLEEERCYFKVTNPIKSISFKSHFK